MENNITNEKLRQFGFLISFVFLILIGWILPHLLDHKFRLWTLFISIPSAVLAIGKPSLLFYPYKAWMTLGKILSWINSQLILGLIFYMILLPIALVMRALGHDPLKTKKLDLKSYREPKNKNQIDLKKIF